MWREAMAAKRSRSLQDLIWSRQQSGFVGRRGELVQYQENLDLPVADDRRRFLFNIHGDAGVGKTFLTRQLRQAAIGRGALAAYVDETADDATAVMIAISAQFAEAGVRLGDFGKRADAYRRRRQELESDPQAPDDIAAFLTKAAVTIGLAAARDIPVAGSVLAPVDPAGAAEQANRARTYLARRLRDHADVRLLLSPADELTPVFVAELNRVAAGRPVALFIDTYERTGLVLDHWLRRLYDGQYGGLPVTLVTTISGQKPLTPNMWGDYLPVIADVPLEPFSDAEARQFLTGKNIHDESMIQVILSLSGQLPLWLATLAETRPGSPSEIGDPAGDAVERFLRWEDDPARRKTAMAAALPRMVNQDVLAEIAGASEVQELFGWLCGLPFVSRRAGSWAYHEVVRAAMLRLQRAQAPIDWKVRQIALAQMHERWAREAAVDSGKTWSDHRWIDHTREQTYHLLCADPDASLGAALTSAVKAAEHSTVRARQWAELIADAGRDTDHDRMRRWGQRLADGIHDDDLTQYLADLINDASLDNGTLNIALGQRGEGNRLMGRYDEAPADFKRVPLPQAYDLVVLRRTQSGRLELGTQPLFLPGARRGDIQRFTVRCLPAGETGTVFAVVASDTPGDFRLISIAAANISPGRYDLTATLLPPGPLDRIRLDGLPVELRTDYRSWQEIVASTPGRLPGPTHLIVAVEICGSAAKVEARIDQASRLISHVASSTQGQVRFSLLSYGSHSPARRIDDVPVTILSWGDGNHDTLERSLQWLRARGPAISPYPRAASIECMLAEVSRQLSEQQTPASRPVLVTIGSRPAFPHRVNPVTHIVPCPLRNDWLAILRQLRDDHPEVTFGAIHDGKPDDPQQDMAYDIWQFLGAHARAQVTSESDVRRFATDLGLASPGLQYIPLPLAD
jgi:hypothetical protein